MRNEIKIRAIFGLLGKPEPTDETSLTKALSDNRFIISQDDGLYAIPAYSAMLFANRLDSFLKIGRKTIRIIKYAGTSKSTIEKNLECPRGYAVSFSEVMQYIALLIPSREILDGAVRSTRYACPIEAVREVLSNALIHQDLSLTGMNVSIEIFDDRIIISNPGSLLVKKDRLVDAAPISRNEMLARTMRRLELCEELGTGWDRIVEFCEDRFLCTPDVHTDERNTSVTIPYERMFLDMTADERIWSCYMHACVMHEKNKRMTNSSLRIRFGLDPTGANSVAISRLIKTACEAGLVKPYDEDASLKNSSYIPYWA